MKTLRDILPALLVFIITLVAAELLLRLLRVSPNLIPSPSAVFAAVFDPRYELLNHTLLTARSSAIGFALSALVGIAAAAAMSASPLAQRAFYPYAVFFQTVPIVAIAPVLVIWFGYGTGAVIASAFIVSIFPVIANTLTGLRSADPALLDLFRLYGSSPATTLWKLKLPSALPHIFTGLRISAGLAVIGAIVGEFIGRGGLGSDVQAAINQQKSEVVFAIVLLGALLGLIFFSAINLASRLTLRRWHPSER